MNFRKIFTIFIMIFVFAFGCLFVGCDKDAYFNNDSGINMPDGQGGEQGEPDQGDGQGDEQGEPSQGDGQGGEQGEPDQGDDQGDEQGEPGQGDEVIDDWTFYF